jgi:hypothetical protein
MNKIPLALDHCEENSTEEDVLEKKYATARSFVNVQILTDRSDVPN